eukprot:2907174-Lingulodinium_polyedra.AAC.1
MVWRAALKSPSTSAGAPPQAAGPGHRCHEQGRGVRSGSLALRPSIHLDHVERSAAPRVHYQ